MLSQIKNLKMSDLAEEDKRNQKMVEERTVGKKDGMISTRIYLDTPDNAIYF